jgi:hypothetical protein
VARRECGLDDKIRHLSELLANLVRNL